MRVSNPVAPRVHPQLQALLTTLRERRGFEPAWYLDAKSEMINDYFREHGLQSCVLAVSGGVDSAVVLGLVACAAAQPNSPIRRIVPVALPVFNVGATNQAAAMMRAHELADHCNLQASCVDLTAAHAAIQSTVDAGVGIVGEDWASGQLVAYARTPALYYITSLLTQAGLPALVLGTTNRDEGAYLGYVGKASDGMVDLQVVADLHKSEIYALARYLELPESVIDVVPSGDMFDGRVDEEVFGAPYDFVELYLNWRCLPEDAREDALHELAPPAWLQFQELRARLEKLHAYNAHKYLVGSPAVHLNLLASAVPGGWEK